MLKARLGRLLAHCFHDNYKATQGLLCTEKLLMLHVRINYDVSAKKELSGYNEGRGPMLRSTILLKTSSIRISWTRTRRDSYFQYIRPTEAIQRPH